MATPIVMPSFGMFTAGGTLAAWLQAPGTMVKEGDTVLEIATDKATYEVPAPASGTLHHVLPVGAALTEQILIGYVLGDGESAPVAAVPMAASPGTAANLPGASATETSAANTPRAADAPIQASPIARRLAKEHGIVLDRLRGSGPGGRVVEADVAAEIARRQNAAATSFAGYRVVRRVPLTGMRASIAQRVRASLANAASLTLTRDVEADKLVDLRARFAASGEDVSFDALFVKLLAAALREHPDLNVILDGDTLLELEDVHIAVAVALPNGLVAPVVRSADAMSTLNVAEQIRDLTVRARAGALRAADLEGASSTISNLGGHAVDAFTPILNAPQSTILGIGRIGMRPVVHGDALTIARTCVLSLTFDHRVTDGAPAAQLLDGIARRMNDDAYLAGLSE